MSFRKQNIKKLSFQTQVSLRSNFKQRAPQAPKFRTSILLKKEEEKKNARAANRQTLILYQVCKIDIRDC